MQNVIDSFDRLPMLLKIVLALPGLDVVWVVYRLLRSAVKNNVVGVIIAVVVIIVGLPWLWVADLICLVAMGKVWWID